MFIYKKYQSRGDLDKKKHQRILLTP